MVSDVEDASGNSVAGKVTNDNRPVLVGIGPAGASITVFADGRGVGKVYANNDGLWSMEVPTALADGKHTFNAAQTGGTVSAAGKQTTTIYTKAPTVTVTAAEFADAQVAPTVSVKIANTPYGYNPMIHYDVDLNGDGKFDGQGETDYAVGGTSQTLWNLPQGTYKIRVRVVDTVGNVGVGTATMQVDPNAGFIGDQDLLELAAGMQNTADPPPVTIPGAWGLVDGSTPGSGSGAGSGGTLAGGGLLGGTGGTNSTADGQPIDKVFFIDSQDRVLVDVRETLPKYYTAFEKELASIGMATPFTTLTPSSNMVSGYLPISNIMELNNLPHFTAATVELRPTFKTGSVESEGDGVILGPEFRASQNVNGAGQKIGVLSDSVNQYQGGLSESVKTGNLPNNVQVLEDDPSGTGSDEGRAMLEIAYDIAPGASLAFHTGDNGAMDFAAGIVALKNAGATVITDDIGYFDSPMFSEGRMGQAVDQVVGAGAVYTTAGGNTANQAWRAAWKPITTKVDSVSGTFENFGGSALQPFTLANGDSMIVSFTWSSAYLEGGDPSANFQVPQDMYAYVVDVSSGKILATYNANNMNTDEAFQDIQFTNNSGDTKLAFAFQLAKGPAPQMLGWALQETGTGNDINALNEGASPLQGQTLSPNALTLGAVDWTNPTTPETFSDIGGNVQVYSDGNGVRYSSATFVQKPDVMAPDGVHVSFDLDGQPEFFGTSAAAPHAAGAAALLLQQAQGATPYDVDQHLRITTKDLLGPGFDPTSGNGLIQLSPLLLSGANGSSPYEPNDTSDTAYNFGEVGSDKLAISAYLGDSIQGPIDYDWYVFTAAVSGAATLKMDNPNLELHVFSYSNGFLTEVSNGTFFAAGSPVFVEVKGSPTGPDSFTTGQYDLVMSIQ